jgi:hypothetical protein
MHGEVVVVNEEFGLPDRRDQLQAKIAFGSWYGDSLGLLRHLQQQPPNLQRKRGCNLFTSSVQAAPLQPPLGLLPVIGLILLPAC